MNQHPSYDVFIFSIIRRHLKKKKLIYKSLLSQLPYIKRYVWGFCISQTHCPKTTTLIVHIYFRVL